MNSHQKWVIEIFDKAAQSYGNKSSPFFNYFGKRLAELADIHPGQRILDVAAGRGAVLFPIAETIGPSGTIIGIDISSQMLKETSVDATKKGMPWIELKQMDAQQLDFSEESFDFVFCGLALFFLPSILTALSEFKRVLKKGGGLLISTWGEDSELAICLREEIKTICHTKSLVATPFWDPKNVHKVLLEAGFINIHIKEELKTFYYNSSQEWWDGLWDQGTRARLEQLSKDQLRILQEKVLSRINILDQGQGIPETFQVFYGIAKK